MPTINSDSDTSPLNSLCDDRDDSNGDNGVHNVLFYLMLLSFLCLFYQLLSEIIRFHHSNK
jgi:hypothetical protein